MQDCSTNQNHFVFLTAEVSVWVQQGGLPGKWETFLFISEPILMTSPIDYFKQRFVSQAEREFPKIKDVINKNLSKNQYEAIKVDDTILGSGKPYSSVEECNAGITTFIQRTKTFYSINELKYTKINVNQL